MKASFENILPVTMIALALFWSAGCSRSEDGKKSFVREPWKPRLENPSVNNLPKIGVTKGLVDYDDDEIVVSVNGENFTRHDFDERLAQARFRISMLPPDIRKNSGDAIYKQTGRDTIPSFVKTTLLVQEARKEKLLTEAELLSAVESNAMLQVKSFRMKPNKFEKVYPGGIDSVRRDCETDAWVRKLISEKITPQCVVSDECVEMFKKAIEAEQAALAATNLVRRKQLEFCRTCALSGEKLSDIAFATSKSGKIEASFYEPKKYTPADFKDPNVWSELNALTRGKISDIIDSEDEYVFYRLLERVPLKKDNDGSVIDEEGIVLESLSIEKDDILEIVMPTDLKNDIKKQMIDAKTKALIDKLMKDAKIIYPHGTNFFTASKQSEKSVKNENRQAK